MSFLRMLFSKKSAEDEQPIAHQINYNGPAPYKKSFMGTGCGVVFEDDGKTGYLYATDERHSQIFDTLHLYNKNTKEDVKQGDEIFIVWNPLLLKAGLYYHDQFQAIVDFKKHSACCRTGFPESNNKWCKTSHKWDEAMVSGLE